jgi:predicted RNA binding protein YcfA (HicA-like mRNA interferase family)
MRLPRDLSGSDLAQALRKFGYSITRQAGSHLRLTTHEYGEHHFTIPPTYAASHQYSQPSSPMWPRILYSPVSSCLSGYLAENEPIPDFFSCSCAN